MKIWQCKRDQRKRKSATGGWSPSRRPSAGISTSLPVTNSAGRPTTTALSPSKSSINGGVFDSFEPVDTGRTNAVGVETEFGTE